MEKKISIREALRFMVFIALHSQFRSWKEGSWKNTLLRGIIATCLLTNDKWGYHNVQSGHIRQRIQAITMENRRRIWKNCRLYRRSNRRTATILQRFVRMRKSWTRTVRNTLYQRCKTRTWHIESRNWRSNKSHEMQLKDNISAKNGSGLEHFHLYSVA